MSSTPNSAASPPSPSDVPELAPPGAGLPPWELRVARCLFGWTRWRGNRESFDRRIREERASILRLVDACPESERAVPVLIPRPRGLEDSSRHWSVWMTLDHLRITNGVFAMVIESLGAGRVPRREASTAAVKPSPEVTGEVETAFEESCEKVLRVVASVPELRTEAHYAHPWFGPLDARGWHALAAVHLGLHRRQLEIIAMERERKAPRVGMK